MKKVSFFTLLFLVLISNTQKTLGCICIQQLNETEKENFQKAYDNSEFVFIGRVIKIIKPIPIRTKHGIDFVMQSKNVFQIIKNWKGVSSKKLVVKVSMTTCEFEFTKGKIYLVYADLTQLFSDEEGKQTAGKQIDVSACSRTTIISEGKKDIEFLKEIINAKDKTGGNLKTNAS